MNTKRSIKLIKKEDRAARQPEAAVGLTDDPVSMSKAVKSWVSEFQKDREDESLSAFDSLFNHSLPEPDAS
ncbi:MAG: hypothetical protein M3Y84_05935 [Acidobacteriota bacterium]|nr:hypothetical protein [Acidobacteriota bacterium]